jgi:hypothetical protein
MVVSVALIVSMAACSDDDGPERTASGVCGYLAPTAELAELASGFDPTDVPRALNRLDAMELQLEQIRDVAPDDARESLDAELDYVRALRDALQVVDPDDPAAAADAVNNLTSEAARANLAASDLQAFEDANCTTTPSTS